MRYRSDREYDNEQGHKIEVTLAGPNGPEAVYHMQLFKGQSTARTWVVLTNCGAEDIGIEYVSSFELLANSMIHQDLQQRGTNPMVEVFKNRIEFSNAGAPLVAIDRNVYTVPVSRNENIAGFMHKCCIYEERGSGYDKIIEATGKNELLAPRIENQNNQFTESELFAKVLFKMTTKEDCIRTCYMQACLAYVNFETVSSGDIRKLFRLSD